MLDAAALTLVPIGVGAAYGRPDEAQSSYLLRAAGRSALLDLGSGTLNRLRAQIDPADLDVILVSHAHPDHWADLLALRVYMAYGPGMGRSVSVLLPEGLEPVVRTLSGDEPWSGVAFETLPPGGGEIELGGLRLVHREVEHLDPTHATRAEAGGRSVVYGADGSPSTALAELADGSDLLVCECSFGLEPGPPEVAHMTGRQAGELARRAGVARLLLTHCPPEHDREATRAAAALAFGGPVAWARQGEAVLA